MSKTLKNDKKKSPLTKVLLSILYAILALLFIFIAWMVFASFQRESKLKAIPENYSIYLRTDSLYKAAEPLIDLKAMDLLLSDPKFSKFRKTFYSIRESKLRKNPLIALPLSRRVDFAMYNSGDYIALVDMGFLSGISRIFPLISDFISIENLNHVKNDISDYYEYLSKGKYTYIKIRKNLVIISSNIGLFNKAISNDNSLEYSAEVLECMQNKLELPFRIIINGKELLSLAANENPYINFLSNSLSDKDLSQIEFSISDKNINLDLSIPFKEGTDAFSKLVTKKSDIPSLLPKLPGSVQYYTIMNMGSLEDLKEAAFTVMKDGKKNVKRMWEDSNNLSKMVFGDSLDDIFFSWTSDEYAVIGLEGKADPVFILKIADEKQRQQVFESILSSIIMQTDNSLLLDGIRLPRIEFPDFISNLLKFFNVNLPRPYYMVKDGFIYFSQSPENLASINASIKSASKLDKNQIWQELSKGKIKASSLSMYYNMERSIPFFARGNSFFNRVLRLYNIGRVELSSEDQTIKVRLNSISCENKETQKVEGFPLQINAQTIPVLYQSNDEKNKLIYFQQKNDTIKVMNSASLEFSERQIDSLSYIIKASEKTYKSTGGDLWAVTKDGLVYLLNESLEDIQNYPLMTGVEPSCPPVIFQNSLLLIGQDNLVTLITDDEKPKQFDFNIDEQIKNPPATYKNYLAIYEKSFLGGIHLLSKNADSFTDTNIFIDSIGFGSPCLFEYKNKVYLSFISQAGELYIWDSTGLLQEGFPISLPGLFYVNVEYFDDSLIALASDGTIYKVGMDKSVTKVAIPHLSAKSAYISVIDYDQDHKNELFICGESNVIYGLSHDLEYLNAFPVAGYGIPVFTDLNGDNNIDITCLTIDNNINAWKLY